MPHIIFAVFLFALSVLPMHGTYAQESDTISPGAIGTIAEIEGTAAMEVDGQPVIPEVGREVFMNDIFETGPDSKLLIIFIDDSEFVIGENARLSIDEYIFDADDTSKNKGRFSVLRGPFVLVSGLISKREDPDVQIETAYGSIGIRGTIVWGGQVDDEYNVFVQEGEITFSTQRGRVKVGVGEGTKVRSKNAIPVRAQKWQEEKIKRAQATVTLRNVAEVKERIAKLKQKHQNMRQKHKGNIEERQQLKQDRRQDNIREHQEKRMENNKEFRPERTDEQKEKIREKMKDNREGRVRVPDTNDLLATPENSRENKTNAARPERTGPALPPADNAPDFEKQEKMHLENRKPTRAETPAAKQRAR